MRRANGQKNTRWHIGMTLLWAYSAVLILISIVPSIFFPGWLTAIESTAENTVIGGMLLIPVFIFIILEGIHHLQNN